MAEDVDKDKDLCALVLAVLTGKTPQALKAIPAVAAKGLLDRMSKDHFTTPLVAAAEKDEISLVAALLDAGASPNASIRDAVTPLHVAAAGAKEEIAALLLERGADPHAKTTSNIPAFRGRTVLMDAVIGKSLPLIRKLLEAGVDPLARDGGGQTAFDVADAQGKRFAAQFRKLVPDNRELSPHDAARAGNVDRVRALLDAGTPVDARAPAAPHETLLIEAIRAGSLGVVELLLSRGAELRTPVRDKLRNTPLHEAARLGKGKIVKALLAAGADVHAVDAQGNTPLVRSMDHLETIQALLEAGADPNAPIEGQSGLTPFLWHCLWSGVPVLTALLDAGADPQTKDAEGRGPIEMAKSNRPAVRAFLNERCGVAPSAADALRPVLKTWPQKAEASEFRTLAAELGTLFHRKPGPWKRRKGGISYPSVSVVKHLAAHYGVPIPADEVAANELFYVLFARLQDEIRAKGFMLVYVNSLPEEGRTPLVLLPTDDSLHAVLAAGTNGVNHGHDNAAVIACLAEIHAVNPLVVAGCGHDFLAARFLEPIRGAETLARKLIEFCPDMADQADYELRSLDREGQIKAVAADLIEHRWFHWWWD